jgi:hypothetical protein
MNVAECFFWSFSSFSCKKKKHNKEPIKNCIRYNKKDIIQEKVKHTQQICNCVVRRGYEMKQQRSSSLICVPVTTFFTRQEKRTKSILCVCGSFTNTLSDGKSFSQYTFILKGCIPTPWWKNTHKYIRFKTHIFLYLPLCQIERQRL